MTARDRMVLVVVLGAALLAGFWFTQIKPKREPLTKLGADIATQQKRLEQAQATEAQATAAKKRYDSDYATVARLGKAVPVDDNVPSLVYQLASAAQGAKVDFRSLKLNASGGGAPAPAPAPTPAPAGSSSGTPTAGTPAATQAAAATLPPGASVGSAGFPTMPFTFVFDGSFFSMEKFLRNVDRFTTVRGDQLSVRGRLLSIDGFSLTASHTGFPKVKATLAATAYLLPADEGLTAGATPAAPAAGGPTTPASGSGSTAAPPPTTTSIVGGTN